MSWVDGRTTSTPKQSIWILLASDACSDKKMLCPLTVYFEHCKFIIIEKPTLPTRAKFVEFVSHYVNRKGMYGVSRQSMSLQSLESMRGHSGDCTVRCCSCHAALNVISCPVIYSTPPPTPPSSNDSRFQCSATMVASRSQASLPLLLACTVYAHGAMYFVVDA